MADYTLYANCQAKADFWGTPKSEFHSSLLGIPQTRTSRQLSELATIPTTPTETSKATRQEGHQQLPVQSSISYTR